MAFLGEVAERRRARRCWTAGLISAPRASLETYLSLSASCDKPFTPPHPHSNPPPARFPLPPPPVRSQGGRGGSPSGAPAFWNAPPKPSGSSGARGGGPSVGPDWEHLTSAAPTRGSSGFGPTCAIRQRGPSLHFRHAIARNASSARRQTPRGQFCFPPVFISPVAVNPLVVLSLSFFPLLIAVLFICLKG